MTKALAALLLSTTLAGSFAGQSFAADIDHPECVAPAKPGGGFDLTCRLAQQGLMDTFGKPLQVTFMPGGIGAVAINQFNTTRTDDPNAIVAFSSGSLLNMAVGKYGEWTEKDVRFLATAGADFGAAVVPGDSKFPDLKSLMDAIKADPQSVIIGAGGSVGSQDWMKAALLFKAVGQDPRKMRYVAFDGGGDAIAGLLGGSIQLYMGDVGEMVSHMGTNAMRILAVMSSERLDAPFQDIPTMNELGYPDAEWTILRGFYMGKNVSDEAYDAWVAAFEKAYADPAFATLQKEKGLMPLDMAGPELVESIKVRVEKMRGIAKEAGLIE
jgi:putative tricarboxylic transport membrane protein